MEVSGQVRVPGTPERVWRALNDPGVLARCLPGCRSLEPDGEDAFRAELSLGLAAVRGAYTGRLRVAERQPPARLRLEIAADGAGGFVRVDGTVELAPAGPAETTAAYRWAVQVGGSVAMAGQRVLGGVARWVVQEFFQCLGREVAAAGEGPA